MYSGNIVTLITSMVSTSSNYMTKIKAQSYSHALRNINVIACRCLWHTIFASVRSAWARTNPTSSFRQYTIYGTSLSSLISSATYRPMDKSMSSACIFDEGNAVFLSDEHRSERKMRAPSSRDVHIWNKELSERDILFSFRNQYVHVRTWWMLHVIRALSLFVGHCHILQALRDQPDGRVYRQREEKVRDVPWYKLVWGVLASNTANARNILSETESVEWGASRPRKKEILSRSW